MSLQKFIDKASEENYKKGLLYDLLFKGKVDSRYVAQALSQIPQRDRIEVLKTIKNGIRWTEKVKKADGTTVNVNKHLNVPNKVELAEGLPEFEGGIGTDASKAFNKQNFRSSQEKFRNELNKEDESEDKSDSGKPDNS